MNSQLLSRLVILALPLCFWSDRCAADLWAPARSTNYISANGKFVFSVIPGMPPGYPPEISEKRRRGLDTGPEGAMAYLYAQGALSNRVDKRLVWDRRLFNLKAPLGTLIPESGRFVVTIDDWGGNRRSTNAVVIYGADGRLIKRFSVADLLSPEERRHVIQSATSFHWGWGHYIDEPKEQLVLRIVTNSALPHAKEARFKEKRISLLTGEVLSDG